jgi:hypothetical protein
LHSHQESVSHTPLMFHERRPPSEESDEYDPCRNKAEQQWFAGDIIQLVH